MKIDPQTFKKDPESKTTVSLQEVVEMFKKEPSKWLNEINYLPKKLAEFIPSKKQRDELITYYEKETLSTLEENAAEKMKNFIYYCRTGFDISTWNMVEKPNGQIHNANIIAKNQNGQTLFDLTGRFLD